MAMESGVAVTIKGFVPTDKSDLRAHRAVLEAVITAEESKDLTALGKLMKIESVKCVPISKREKSDG